MKNLFLLHYLPPIEWFVYWLASEDNQLEFHDNFQKASYRNRCYIASPNGEQLLSIPLVSGKHQKKKYKDVEICNEHPWQKEHWKSFCSAYRSSPYFEYYESRFEEFYQSEHRILYMFNLALLGEIFHCLKLETETLELSETYHKDTTAFDTRIIIVPKDRKDAELFKDVKYLQVFQNKTGFIPGLSIVDLLFNEGPASRNILELAAQNLMSKEV